MIPDFDIALQAQLDQHEANLRDHTDKIIDSFAGMLSEDPTVSQTWWAMVMQYSMTPGQLAALASELLFRAARRRGESGG